MSSSADPDDLLAYAVLAGAADLDLATEVSGRLAPALEALAASRPEYGHVPVGLVGALARHVTAGADVADWTARVAAAFRAADRGAFVGPVAPGPVTVPAVPDVGPVHPPVAFPSPSDLGGGPDSPDPSGQPFSGLNDLTGAYATPAGQAAVERARAQAAAARLQQALDHRHSGLPRGRALREAKRALAAAGRSEAAAAARAGQAGSVTSRLPGGSALTRPLPGLARVPGLRAVPGVGVVLTAAATAQEIRTGGDPVETVAKNGAGLAAGTLAGAGIAAGGAVVGAPVIATVVVGAGVAYGVGKGVEWAVGKLF